MGSAITIEQFSARMALLSSGALYSAILREADLIGRFGRSQMIANATKKPKVRSGRLRASSAYVVKSMPAKITIGLHAGGMTGGTSVKYAKVQDVGTAGIGGPITPKRGKYLAIPLDPARQATGTARAPSPRDYPNLRFGPRSRRGNPLLVDEASGEPYFVLVRSVTIPPTYYMRNAFYSMRDRATVRLSSVLRDEVG
jgi:hypothetical protein